METLKAPPTTSYGTEERMDGIRPMYIRNSCCLPEAVMQLTCERVSNASQTKESERKGN